MPNRRLRGVARNIPSAIEMMPTLLASQPLSAPLSRAFSSQGARQIPDLRCGSPLTAAIRTGPRRNLLLDALPPDAYARLAPDLKFMQVQAGDVLLDSGAQSRNVYFPATALVSLLNVTTDGASAQIAVVGVDGIVGVTNFMGGGLTTTMAVVQGRGDIYWMAARCLTDEFDRAGPAMRLLLRYTQALMSQIAQTTVCNRHHSVEQRLCRCLLLNLDRLPRVDKMMMSQYLLTGLLGTGRRGVSEAAQRLQEAGVIRYARGQMTVSDRGGLEARVCECYAVVRRECDRLRSYPVS